VELGEAFMKLSRFRHTVYFFVVSAMLIGSGCASVPKPVAEMASARTAIRAIEGGDARTLAPVELDRAKSKLQRAEAAANSGDNADATRLAEEALADAELATAKTNMIKAERNAEELERSIAVMRKEIERAQSQR
jgi:hypothetical protein